MDQQARAAFIIAQVACCTAEIAAMQAENAAAVAAGRSPPWSGESFRAVPVNHGVDWDSAVAYLMGG